MHNAEKLLSISIAFGTAFGYVWSGMYGDIATLGAIKAMIIVLQLTIAGIMVLYIDEMMQKGYGIGSGQSHSLNSPRDGLTNSAHCAQKKF